MKTAEIPDSEGRVHQWEIGFIPGRACTELCMEFAGLVGPAGAEMLSALSREVVATAMALGVEQRAAKDAGLEMDSPTVQEALEARLSKNRTAQANLLAAASAVFRDPKAFPLVRALCGYAVRDGQPLESDEDFDVAFNGNPWEAQRGAVQVAVVNHFFPPASTLGDVLGRGMDGIAEALGIAPAETTP